MVKTAVLSFRIQDDTKEAITKAAAAEDRSVSWLVEQILREWLVQRELLPKPQGHTVGNG